MKKRTLAFKLVAGGIAAVAIPLLVVGLFSVTKASTALRQTAEDQAITVAKDLVNMTQMVMAEEVKLIDQLALGAEAVSAASAASSGIDIGSSQELKELTAQLHRTRKKLGNDYEVILVSDLKGHVFADSNSGEYVGLSLADRDYFKSTKQGKTSISEPVKSKISGNPIVPVCAPIATSSGDIVGTLTAVLKIDFLAEKFASVKIGGTGFPFMVDKNGLLFVHPNKKHVLELGLAKIPGMEAIAKAMMAGETGVQEYRFEGVSKIAGYAPVALTGWIVCITQTSSEFLEDANQIRNVILMVGGGFLVLTVLAVLFFARSIVKPINRVVELMKAGSDEVASASTQVSSASQSLAEGSSEQAASIEETSSSLEEISSMTKQNAEHAVQANQLMKEVNQIIAQADESMKLLTASMQDISQTSEETQKIVKTIDEIAFQTNLLALNAAVEAARAGEAGAGFAVVADEVRNLAIRAAEAAKNTSAMIDGSVKKIKKGSELVETSNTAFRSVSLSASKATALVEEIAGASREQSQGIEQINTAVGEMDKVVQQNAANAEESASASEELNGQAEQMLGVVNELVSIVGGVQDSSHSNDPVSKKKRPSSAKVKTGPAPRSAGNSKPSRAAQHLIPFDEASELKDF